MAAKKRRRVTRWSTLERILTVAIVCVLCWLGYDLYRRWHPKPAIGGLAAQVFAPGGGAAPTHAASPHPGRGDARLLRFPSLYDAAGGVGPSGYPTAPPMEGGYSPHPKPPPLPPAGPRAAPSSAASASPEEVEIHFPSWNDVPPELRPENYKR